MIKLIKLCLVCCLMLRVTFVEADIKNYQEYIAALKELEEQYKAIDKTIDLSGCTMREVICRLHNILRIRIHNLIGTSQEEDSHPALLKVNDVFYELYFHNTKDMPGNCSLKQQGKKGNAWLKGKKKEEKKYNSELNTKENYVEQNLLFCLEIARRKFSGDKYEKIEITKAVVSGIFLKEAFSKEFIDKDFFGGCFSDKCGNRKDNTDKIIKSFENKYQQDEEAESIGVLRKKFLDKKITDRLFTVTEITDLINNQKVVDKLKKQNFTHWEFIESLTPQVLDATNFSERTTESVIEAINSVKFSSLPFDPNDGVYKESIKKISEKLSSPVYVLDGNATKDFVKFLAQKNTTRKQKKIIAGEIDSVQSLYKKHFEKGFVFFYATGKDGITRWFYLNKSNGTMYLLSETGAEQPNH